MKALQEHGEGVPLRLLYRAVVLESYKRREGNRQPFGKDVASKFQWATNELVEVEERVEFGGALGERVDERAVESLECRYVMVSSSRAIT